MIMEKVTSQKYAASMALEEVSSTSERLYYLLQTLNEFHEKMEPTQRLSLTLQAWHFADDIYTWMRAEEKRREK